MVAVSLAGKQVVAVKAEDTAEVDLQELFGYRAGARPIEPPFGAIAEDAPAQPSVGQIVDAPQIAEHLGRGRSRLVTTGGAVERAAPALAFHRRQAMAVALPFLRFGIRCGLGFGVGEKQSVRHILAPGYRQILLPEAFAPPQRTEDRPDEIVFGLTFVRPMSLWKRFGDTPELRAQICQIDCAIFLGRRDRLDEIVEREQAARREKKRIVQFLGPSPPWRQQPARGRGKGASTRFLGSDSHGP